MSICNTDSDCSRCNHVMGYDCISTWLSPASGEGHNTCPYCRRELFSTPPRLDGILAMSVLNRRLHESRDRLRYESEVLRHMNDAVEFRPLAALSRRAVAYGLTGQAIEGDPHRRQIIYGEVSSDRTPASQDVTSNGTPAGERLFPSRPFSILASLMRSRQEYDRLASTAGQPSPTWEPNS